MHLPTRDPSTDVPADLLADLADESGATAIEYALIAGLMALVCVAAFTQLGVVVQAFYTVTQTLVAAAI